MSYKNLQYFAVFTLIFLSVIWYYTGKGMFMDGLIYATIARNISLGIGNFFNPIHIDQFDGNLCLIYWIQSLFFKILGSTFWVEKLHNFIFLLLNIFLILRIYKFFNPGSVLPLLIWWFCPIVPWIFTNNMMEITVSFFFLLSLYFYLKYYECREKKHLVLYIIVSLLASYTKAFVGFFPFIIPFIHFITFRNKITIDFFREYFLILTCLCFFFIAVFTYQPAWDQWLRIVSYQMHSNDIVITSFWESKLHFIKEFISCFWPQVLFILILVIIKKQKKYFISFKKEVSFFGILFLFSVIPFAIFKKFFGFYLAISAPFLALGLATFILQFKPLVKNQSTFLINKKFIFVLLLLLNTTGFVISIYHFGMVNRDKTLIEDSEFIASKINLNTNSYLNLSPDFGYDFYAQAYLARAIPKEIRMYTADSISNFKGYYISKNYLDKNSLRSPNGLYFLNYHP